MSNTLAASYRYCQRLTRQAAGNFYYSFLTLPREQFQAMCALYAYMRIVDDIGDDGFCAITERQQKLDDWEHTLDMILTGESLAHPIAPALADIVERYQIDTVYFHDVIGGIRCDLDHHGFETFAELERYCYQVAGVVGICCLHIWGFDGEEALPFATDCGTAFQLTNILRDLGEDIDRGRIYLPQDDLKHFDYGRDEIKSRIVDDRFQAFMQFQIKRTRHYYRQVEHLYAHLHDSGKPILSAMCRIYGGLLDEIERNPAAVYQKRIRLSFWRKLYIAIDSRIRAEHVYHAK